MTVPLDPAGDPDRFDPSRSSEPLDDSSGEAGPLDWALDPDRYDPASEGSGSTLPELIGADRSFQDKPNPYSWALGLVAILAFLLLVAFVFSHLSPR